MARPRMACVWGSAWVLLASLAPAAGAAAAVPGAPPPPAGSLDPTFGTGGGVVTEFAPGGEVTHSFVRDAVVQPDGKVVVVGALGPDFARSMLVARYTQRGALDPTFGAGGVVKLDYSSDPAYWEDSDSASAVALLPDGKLLVLGSTSSHYGQPSGTLLARFRPDGTLDPTFDGDGMLVTQEAGGADMAVRPDGRIVLAGGRADGTVVVSRLRPDGSLDPGFGTGGHTTATLGGPESDIATDVVVLPDGRIVVSAVVDRLPTLADTSDFGVLRLRPDGRLDPRFGSGGATVTDMGGADRPAALAVTRDGRVVLAGEVERVFGLRDFAVARYRRDGTLDPTFGDDGRATTAFADVEGSAEDYAVGLVVRRDGGLIVAGTADAADWRWCNCGPARADLGLVGYRRDGSLDPTFGTGGRLTVDLGRSEQASVVVPAPGGRFVVAGLAWMPFSTRPDTFVARFHTGDRPR